MRKNKCECGDEYKSFDSNQMRFYCTKCGRDVDNPIEIKKHWDAIRDLNPRKYKGGKL